MVPTAKVYRRTRPDGTLRSPFWHAVFLAWDAERQAWKPVMKSTRCEDQAKALQIAREFERISQAAGGPDGGTRLSREYIEESIQDILRLAGHRPTPHTKRWSDYSQAWLAATKARVPTSLSLGTWNVYRQHVAAFTAWLGTRASLPLPSITGDLLQEWYQEGIAEGRAIGTMNMVASTIGSIFERAKDEGFTTRNPINLITRQSGKNTRDPFSMEQMDLVLQHLRSTKQHDWLTVALLGFCTSQRLTDCANALRSQFEVGGKWITWNLTQQKTKKEIRIPLVEPLASHMAHLLSVPPSSLFVAPSLAGTSPGSTTGLSTQFNAILERAGIVGRKVNGKGAKGRAFRSLTFHSTRHTCNTLLANAGVPFEIRKLITGHADEATNVIYTHLDDATKAKALTKAFKRPTTKKAL